ncbi:MAG: excinuclease ABC subunit UvrA [Acidobacteriota bacterium]
MRNILRVVGARENNLKNISVDIPRDQLVVITGLSGSGKSSLAFDTIYAEGQRRYVESLSSYARQFLGIMDKPDVDRIDGLSPAISIDQKSTSRNPRSTVATVTEIYDYLRLLFARVGVPHCPVDGNPVSRRSPEAIIDEIVGLGEKRLVVLAPIVSDKKGEFQHIPEQYTRQGFARARVDGVIYALDEFPELEKQYKHTIEIVVDRLVNNEASRGRLVQSVEQALELAGDTVMILDADNDETHMYSRRYACLDHPDIMIPELEPRLFSFNAPQGACPVCTGLGSRLEVDPELVFNQNLTIAEGAIRPYNRVNSDAWWMKKLVAVADKHGFSLHMPVRDLSDEVRQKILYGTDKDTYRISLGSGRHYDSTYEGVIPNLERRWKETDSEFMRRDIERFMREMPCYTCKGRRLKPEILAVTVEGLNIMDMCDLSVSAAVELLQQGMTLTEKDMEIAQQILKEIMARLGFMYDVGLGYLTLSRAANTLSGGEAQRIRLATQIGSGLQGVLYVLDEPSIGLHQRDNDKLIATLKHLRDLGNSVVVVEHDEDTIRQADYLLDIGPGAGVHGGEVCAAGTPDEVAKNPRSITGKYLSGELAISTPKKRRKGNGKILKVVGAKEHNLKNVTVEFPLGLLTIVTGVSGSGKSTLVNDIVAKELAAQLHRAHEVAGSHEAIEGIQQLDKVIVIDQSPIGRTPRSNPATYTGVFTAIRELFAGTPEAEIRGYKAGRFSFNVRGGRCENCQGDGVIKIEMHFLPDVYVQCEVCHGKRYNREALEIKFKHKTISDVLDMTVEQAAEFFENQPAIKRKMDTLVEVGLGYIKLGQPATTFSGGEAQRIKLATELSRRATGKTLYILDEPTTGLHTDDVKKLLHVLQALVDTGNSMVIIEHNLEVIKCADHIIDMGPEGGEGGGQVIATGTPEDIAKVAQSYTGQYLKTVL